MLQGHYLVLKLYDVYLQTKICGVHFKATADAADKGKIYSICSTPELSERNYCDGLEVKVISPLGGI